MHCPNCGTKIYTAQKFCRACGLPLEPFAQLLAELAPDAEDENVAQSKLRLYRLKEGNKRVGQVLVWSIVFAIVVQGAKVMIKPGNIGAGILLFTLAAVIALLGDYYYGPLRQKVSDQESSRAAPLAETTNKLLSDSQSQIAMNVTERTTARLQEKIEPRRLDE